jgi:kynurenine formamidase
MNHVSSAHRSSAVLVGILFLTLVLHAQSGHVVDSAMIERWMTELSNWGRWGKDDQRGTLNLITPERSRKALTLAREGLAVSLSHPYLEQKADDVGSPFGHEMVVMQEAGPFVLDRFSVMFHGFAHTHMDALCHMSHHAKMYNGFTLDTIGPTGCTKLAIADIAPHGLIARGVLIDVGALKGVSYLEPGTAIYAEDIEAWEKRAKVKIGAGDIVLVRNGRWRRRATMGPWQTATTAAGLHASVMPWLKARDVAMLGSDNTNDVLPSGVEGVGMPVHLLTLVAMGMPLFDNLDLEDLAEAAAKRNRWEFLLVAAPLTVNGGTGSPLNPIAIF